MPLKAAIPRENMRLVRAGVVAVLGLLCMSAVYPSRLTAADIAGSWCFVEQSGFGQSVEEKIEIHFSQDGHYTWTEGTFRTRETWTRSAQGLAMARLGTLEILASSKHQLLLRGSGSTLRLVRGSCPKTGFSSQDRLEFHNAAISGDLLKVQSFLDRGLPADTRDLTHSDTALIKAAKGCHVDVARALLKRGASAQPVNADGRNALNYALKSNFHQGCPELVKLLRGRPSR